MEENIDSNNKAINELSDYATKIISEEIKEPKSEKVIDINDNNLKKDRNYSNSPDNKDGWDNEDFEW